MSSAKDGAGGTDWTRNLNAKTAALPMIFTTLVVFVGCSLVDRFVLVHQV